MAIEKAMKYVPILDQKYVASSKTAILDSTEESKFIKEANQFLVAMREMEGLADYDRVNGYNNTGVTLTWEPYKVDYDRGRMLNVDYVDNEEAAGMAFLNIAGQFMDEHVTPEIDAVRIAKYASKAGNKKEETLTDSKKTYEAVRAAITAVENNHVPVDNRVTFISVTHKGMLEDMDTYKSKAALTALGTIVTVSDSEFKTICTLTEGGFELSGSNINFMIVSKNSIIQHLTHVAPKIVTPEVNQTADAWKYGYRTVGMADVYKNKVNGIYLSYQPVSA